MIKGEEGMASWKIIPKDLKIPHDDMVIVRKPNDRGGWNIELAYRSKGAGWRIGSGYGSVSEYLEWTEIPK